MLCLTALPLLLGTVPAQAPDASTVLADVVAHDWSFRLEHDPLLATSTGSGQGLDRLPDVGDGARDVWKTHTEEALKTLRTLDPGDLEETERATFEILTRLLEDRLADQEFGAWMIPINSDSGFHTTIARLPSSVPLDSLEDYRAYIARLHGIDGYFEQQIDNMRTGLGLEQKMTLSRVILEGYDQMAGEHADVPLEESVFWQPFTELPSTLPEEEREDLLEQGRTGVQAAIDAYGTLRDFFRDEYIPGARETVGAIHLQNGRAYYEHLVRHFTTLDLSPEEVHETGLAEVARIREEMQGIIDSVGFEGTFADYLEHLRTDERYYAKSGEELLERASRICKRMDAALPSMFTRLPRQPYGVEPVPDSIAPRYTGGRYVSAPIDGKRAGTYWVNTYNLPSRPLYVLEALSLHEAVPGHHLQHALAAEIEGIPAFRNHLYHSAFGEGWALYCEALGKEIGFYQDPVSDFGRLTYEMWRACRLVVDTGIHALDWDRERALAYLAGNTALSLHEVGTEIDRYIAWPGQALSYKIGELEIWRLRRQAEEAQGEEFDLRLFHDAILAQGSVPLPTLRRVIREQFDIPR